MITTNNTNNTTNNTNNTNNNSNNSSNNSCEKLLCKALVDVRWQQYGYGGRRLAAVHAVLSYGAAVDLAQGKSVTILAW